MSVNVTEIIQRPLYSTLPVGQEIIFAVKNQQAVINETKVKYIAKVYISSSTPPVISSGNDLIGTFKIAPNNAGVGMMDFSNIVEKYVSADNLAANGSQFKTQRTADDLAYPLHVIDKYSKNKNIIRYLVIRFSVEYLDTATNLIEEVTGTAVLTGLKRIFNGYLKRTDPLVRGVTFASPQPNTDFGFDPTFLFPQSSSPGVFLTNAPKTQYANADDYGTFGFATTTSSFSTAIRKIRFKAYNSAGVLQSTDSIIRNNETSAVYTGSYKFDNFTEETNKLIQYIGVFPGNLRNWDSNFKASYDNGDLDGGYYEIDALDNSNNQTLQRYTIYINCPNKKGYESVRLCWLNQWGVWDYYTFTQKSTRKTTTKGTTYNQLAGSWNDSFYIPNAYKGGKKSFRINAIESLTINTEFLSEDDNVMFEELTNSPEVYILKGYDTSPQTTAVLNEHVTPVRLKSTTFTKKTIANDKLIQYTFEIEKSETLRTQSV